MYGLLHDTMVKKRALIRIMRTLKRSIQREESNKLFGNSVTSHMAFSILDKHAESPHMHYLLFKPSRKYIGPCLKLKQAYTLSKGDTIEIDRYCDVITRVKGSIGCRFEMTIGDFTLKEKDCRFMFYLSVSAVYCPVKIKCIEAGTISVYSVLMNTELRDKYRRVIVGGHDINYRLLGLYAGGLVTIKDKEEWSKRECVPLAFSVDSS